MKSTKTQLKKIIREELIKENRKWDNEIMKALQTIPGFKNIGMDGQGSIFTKLKKMLLEYI